MVVFPGGPHPNVAQSYDVGPPSLQTGYCFTTIALWHHTPFPHRLVMSHSTTTHHWSYPILCQRTSSAIHLPHVIFPPLITLHVTLTHLWPIISPSSHPYISVGQLVQANVSVTLLTYPRAQWTPFLPNLILFPLHFHIVHTLCTLEALFPHRCSQWPIHSHYPLTFLFHIVSTYWSDGVEIQIVKNQGKSFPSTSCRSRPVPSGRQILPHLWDNMWF